MERLINKGKIILKEIKESVNTIQASSFSEFAALSRQYGAKEVLVTTEYIEGKLIAPFGSQGAFTRSEIRTNITTINANRRVNYEIEHEPVGVGEKNYKLVATADHCRNMTMLTLPEIPINITVTGMDPDTINEIVEHVRENNIHPFPTVRKNDREERR
jgi:hypothetical protein